MKLEDFGYNAQIKAWQLENKSNEFIIGRVVVEHKERYIVYTENGEVEAEITGNLRFAARGREDFPAVGDWVLLLSFDSDFALIHKILPRSSVIARQAVGRSGEKQIIATNVDEAFLVQAVDRDFNVNRLERYLTICYDARVKPTVVLTKTDLIDACDLSEIIDQVTQRIENIAVIAVSNATQDGYDLLKKHIQKGKTYCMLGSSGVGKSSMTNNLSGRTSMKTDAISNSTGKGRHVTSHRELIVLDGGGILIDNPGMREVGIADSGSGLDQTFDKILSFSKACRYGDCTHVSEPGCAVLAALENGEIDAHSYENYLSMEKERTYFESTVAERKKKDKALGKILKDYQKKDIKQRGK